MAGKNNGGAQKAKGGARGLTNSERRTYSSPSRISKFLEGHEGDLAVRGWTYVQSSGLLWSAFLLLALLLGGVLLFRGPSSHGWFTRLVRCYTLHK